MTKRDLFYALTFGIAMMGFLFFMWTRGTSPEDPCLVHKELFFAKIESGIVVSKMIEKENHGAKKITIKIKDKTYEMEFIHYDNWTDFERINVDDVISKPAKSFHFIVNETSEFDLKYDCSYTKE
jgi:hypothetical protein